MDADADADVTRPKVRGKAKRNPGNQRSVLVASTVNMCISYLYGQPQFEEYGGSTPRYVYMVVFPLPIPGFAKYFVILRVLRGLNAKSKVKRDRGASKLIARRGSNGVQQSTCLC